MEVWEGGEVGFGGGRRHNLLAKTTRCLELGDLVTHHALTPHALTLLLAKVRNQDHYSYLFNPPQTTNPPSIAFETTRCSDS